MSFITKDDTVLVAIDFQEKLMPAMSNGEETEERAAKLPEDTKHCDLEMWTKGELLDDAEIGDDVRIRTAVGRTEHGRLIEVEPYYTHSYGKFVPEIIEIDKKLREEMGGIA